ncbi:MAG TPA: hypothetical protein VFT74_01535, partial [Isosphaeraceae bacterium]|nr:hypothetical protein [Isosphaeraceae bacterium]
MHHKLTARFAVFGKRFSLLIALGFALPAMAQDGLRRTGVPVTNPETDKEIHRPVPPVNPTEDSADLLPPVPASINDPAPFGTRAVGVAPGAPGTVPPGAAVEARQGQPNQAVLAGIHQSEGVVIGIEQPKDSDSSSSSAGQELVRLKFDPNQSWLQYSTEGPRIKPSTSASAPGREKGTDRVPDAAPEKPGTRPALPGGPTSPIMTL